jgi:hypothetical protein
VRGSVWGGMGLVESPECHFPEPGGEVPSKFWRSGLVALYVGDPSFG